MSALSSAAFAMFALQQPMSLQDLAASAGDHRLPMADPHTPDWFAAMATGGSSLVDIAPELRTLPVEAELPSASGASGLDLVRIYSDQIPELEVDEVTAPATPPEEGTSTTPVPEASRQIGLLKELEGLDE